MTVQAPKLIVVALGGNAISAPDVPPDIPNQFTTTARTAECLTDLIEAGHRLVLTHGNGPQVGGVLRRVELARDVIYTLPLEICVADTQGGMGYMIAQCLTNALNRRGRHQTVTSIVTTVLVDRDDPAFADPSKPIGRFFDEPEARELGLRDDWQMKEVLEGRFRRVVASPKPTQILEHDSIKQLVDAGQLVIACGGGGVPVVSVGTNQFEGVAAVVDKDLASALLACNLDADGIIILTSVDRVCINFQKANQRALESLTIAEARQYLSEGQFPAGSMGPKIEAAIQFLDHSSKADAFVLITHPDQMTQALAGEGGTWIHQ